ncbi:hypothetical protein [Weissella cibaria]|uniref:hypothetical protein n=1 Tax=Weissella cibaria TaxID=137591 RepID=UPI001C1F4658|nr:hypothetical protein [Weissella cibaria]MBU7544747.1 hypothetical protein [Weissella cibaria]MCV3317724.1 hypothetical protein [Weissella cibaria]
MNFENEFSNIISKVSKTLGKEITDDSFQILNIGHTRPTTLPKGKMAVYTFYSDESDEFLKIGKVGPNSNTRYTSQHYQPKSSKSNLASSILKDATLVGKEDINEENVGQWILNNLYRTDIILDADLGPFALDLVEASLHYVYQPKYEGYGSQRK